jgi:hypothetical protein
MIYILEKVAKEETPIVYHARKRAHSLESKTAKRYSGTKGKESRNLAEEIEGAASSYSFWNFDSKDHMRKWLVHQLLNNIQNDQKMQNKDTSKNVTKNEVADAACQTVSNAATQTQFPLDSFDSSMGVEDSLLMLNLSDNVSMIEKKKEVIIL